MQFIELFVKTAFIVHGFDEHNKEIIEQVNEADFTRKLIAIQRVQSISEDYVLVTGSHGRVMYWQYDCTLDELKTRLQELGLMI